MFHTADYDLLPNLEENLEFMDNPDQRTPCVLLLDTSLSLESSKPWAAGWDKV